VAEMRALGTRARRRSIPGEWSANEVLGHLIEADRRGFVGRVRSILSQDRPTFVPWDQPAVSAARRDMDRDPEALVAEFLVQRDADLRLVASLETDALERCGVHPVVGELSVSDLLHEWVHHDREHLAQMLALTQAFVFPAMGNARRFSDPDA
jgi:hypothetical protein